MHENAYTYENIYYINFDVKGSLKSRLWENLCINNLEIF